MFHGGLDPAVGYVAQPGHGIATAPGGWKANLDEMAVFVAPAVWIRIVDDVLPDGEVISHPNATAGGRGSRHARVRNIDLGGGGGYCFSSATGASKERFV